MEQELFTILNERYDPTLADLVKNMLGKGNITVENLKKSIDEQLKAHPVMQLDTKFVKTAGDLEYIGWLCKGHIYLASDGVIRGRVKDICYSKDGGQPEHFHNLIDSGAMPEFESKETPKSYIN